MNQDHTDQRFINIADEYPRARVDMTREIMAAYFSGRSCRQWSRSYGRPCEFKPKTGQTVKAAWGDVTPVYEMARELRSANPDEGWCVDHIFPTNGSWVSGLHVPENLQILRGAENTLKGTKRPNCDPDLLW